jgi:hypothetical protein
MVWVIAGIWVMMTLVVVGVIVSAVVDMVWPRGEPEAAQPQAAQPQAAQPQAAQPQAAQPQAAQPQAAQPQAAQPQAAQPVHITTVEDVLAWGERMRAEIVAWAQKQDPSPSPPEPAEAGRDPPATARSPHEARLASGKPARTAPWRAGLSVATVQKTLRPLKAEGLVVGSPGYAMLVAER